MNSNDPAFPAAEFYDEKQVGCYSGLTKREYIASACMAGILPTCRADENSVDAVIATVARYSVKAADALLAELAK